MPVHPRMRREFFLKMSRSARIPTIYVGQTMEKVKESGKSLENIFAADLEKKVDESE